VCRHALLKKPTTRLVRVVLRRLGRCSFGSDVAPGHTTVDNKVCTIDETALVASEEENGLSLLNGFAEATSREVDFTTGSLNCVVTKPILQKGSAGIISSRTSEEARSTYLSGAGQRELNRKASLAWQIANSRVNAMTAPLLAVYASCGVALPTSATTLAVLITLAVFFPCFLKLKTAYLLPNHTPFTLMACVRSQIFSGVSIASASSACIMPALLKRTSTPPQESRCSTMALTSASLETSVILVSILLASGTISFNFATAFSSAGPEMSDMRMLAPSRAKRMHVSKPMPLH
jgi:hypothetical protein